MGFFDSAIGNLDVNQGQQQPASQGFWQQQQQQQQEAPPADPPPAPEDEAASDEEASEAESAAGWDDSQPEADESSSSDSIGDDVVEAAPQLEAAAPSLTSVTVSADPDDGSDHHPNSVQVSTDAAVTLSWFASDASSVRIDPLGSFEATGSTTIPAEEASYTLVAIAEDGTESDPWPLEVHTHEPGEVVSQHVDLSSGVAALLDFQAYVDGEIVSDGAAGSTVTLRATVSDCADAVFINGMECALQATGTGESIAQTEVVLSADMDGAFQCQVMQEGSEAASGSVWIDISGSDADPPAIDSVATDKEKYKSGEMATVSWSLSGGPVESITFEGPDGPQELPAEQGAITFKVAGPLFTANVVAKEEEHEVSVKLVVHGPGGDDEREVPISVESGEDIQIELAGAEMKLASGEGPELEAGVFKVETGYGILAKGTLILKPGPAGEEPPSKDEGMEQLKQAGVEKMSSCFQLISELKSLTASGNFGLNNFSVFKVEKSHGWEVEVAAMDLFTGTVHDPLGNAAVEVKLSLAGGKFGVKKKNGEPELEANVLQVIVSAEFPIATIDLGNPQIVLEGGLAVFVEAEGGLDLEALKEKLEADDEAEDEDNEEDDENEKDNENEKDSENEDPNENEEPNEPDADPDADPPDADPDPVDAADGPADGAADAGGDVVGDGAADAGTDALETVGEEGVAIVGAETAVIGGFLLIGVSLVGCSIISIKESEDICRTRGDADLLAEELSAYFLFGARGQANPHLLLETAAHTQAYERGAANYQAALDDLRGKNPDASDDDLRAAIAAHADEALASVQGSITASARQTVWESFASNHQDTSWFNYEEDRWAAWSNIYGDDPRGCAEYAKFRNQYSTKGLGM